jgi:hypothetical protein
MHLLPDSIKPLAAFNSDFIVRQDSRTPQESVGRLAVIPSQFIRSVCFKGSFRPQFQGSTSEAACLRSVLYKLGTPVSGAQAPNQAFCQIIVTSNVSQASVSALKEISELLMIETERDSIVACRSCT